MSDFAPPPPPLDDNDSVTLYSADQQDSDIPKGWKPTPAKPLPAVRCQFIKKDGVRCKKWGVPGTGGWCVKHGAGLPSMRAAAARRVEEARTMLMGAAPEMYEVLYSLTKPGVPEGIRLKAATEIMDRAGLKAGMEVAVTVEVSGSPLEDILTQLKTIGGHDEEEVIEDAEIVT